MMNTTHRTRPITDTPILRPLSLLIVTSLIVIQYSVEAGDWPQFRGLDRDGKSTERGLLSRWPDGGPRLLWSVQGVGKGFTHVAVAGGPVLLIGMGGEEGYLQHGSKN